MLGKRGPISSSFGPASTFTPLRLMWSEISIRLPGAHLRAQRAGGVGEHEDLGARPRAARGRACGSSLEVAALVHVRAALEHRHRHAADAAQHRAPAVARHARRAGSRAARRSRSWWGPPRRRPPRRGPSRAPRPRAARRPERSFMTAAAASPWLMPRGSQLERQRQQLADGRGLARSVQAPRWTGRVRARELREPLAAAAAGRADVHALGRHRHLSDPRRPAATSAPIAEVSAHWPCG